MSLKNSFLTLLSIGLLLACSDEKSEMNTKPTEQKVVMRDVSPQDYSQGRKLFLKNCATCHGLQGEGAKNWRTPDEKGKNPAPPLNGTGHAWHHSMKALSIVIRNGTAKIGGNMPAWKDKLSNSEIKLILTWITSQWSDETYTAWYNRFYHEK